MTAFISAIEDSLAEVLDLEIDLLSDFVSTLNFLHSVGRTLFKFTAVFDVDKTFSIGVTLFRSIFALDLDSVLLGTKGSLINGGREFGNFCFSSKIQRFEFASLRTVEVDDFCKDFLLFLFSKADLDLDLEMT